MTGDTLILFLVRRIVCFSRLSVGASPSHKLFWSSQIITYQANLKQVIGGAK